VYDGTVPVGYSTAATACSVATGAPYNLTVYYNGTFGDGTTLYTDVHADDPLSVDTTTYYYLSSANVAIFLDGNTVASTTTCTPSLGDNFLISYGSNGGDACTHYSYNEDQVSIYPGSGNPGDLESGYPYYNSDGSAFTYDSGLTYSDGNTYGTFYTSGGNTYYNPEGVCL
jgi:hypothetical protein